MRDAYAESRDAMIAEIAEHLPASGRALDAIEHAAVESAVVVDVALDEMDANCKRLETDTRGLRR